MDRILKSDTKGLEILSALWFLAYSLGLLLIPNVRESISYRGLREVASDSFWIPIFFVVGAAQLIALITNRCYYRKWTSFVAAMLWAGVSTGVFVVTGANMASFIYASMSVAMGFAFWQVYLNEQDSQFCR